MRGAALRIVVCVRAIPDVRNHPPELDSGVGRLRPESLALVINDDDLLALEQALRIRARVGAGAEVIAVSVGGEPIEGLLRTCLAMGVDRATRIPREADVRDGIVTARVLAQAIEKMGYELILCGQTSLEGMHGIVGPAIAHHLGVPLLAGVVKLELAADSTRVLATQKLEKGGRCVWEAPLPSVCVVQEGINVPRYVPVHRRILCRRSPVIVMRIERQRELAEQVVERYGSLRLERVSYPRIRPKKTAAPAASLSPAERLKSLQAASGGARRQNGKAERIEGDPHQVCARIVQFLAERGFV